MYYHRNVASFYTHKKTVIYTERAHGSCSTYDYYTHVVLFCFRRRKYTVFHSLKQLRRRME